MNASVGIAPAQNCESTRGQYGRHRILLCLSHPQAVDRLHRDLLRDVGASVRLVRGKPGCGIGIRLLRVRRSIHRDQISGIVRQIRALLQTQLLRTLLPRIAQRDHMVNLNGSRSILSPNKIDGLSGVRISQRARENNTLLLSFFEDHVSQPRSQQIIARIAPVMPELHIDIIRPGLTELISAVTSFRSTPLHRKGLQQRDRGSHINIVLTDRALHRQRSCWDHIRQRRTATGDRQPDQGSDGNQEGTGTHQATMQRETPKSYAVQRICTLINKLMRMIVGKSRHQTSCATHPPNPINRPRA